MKLGSHKEHLHKHLRDPEFTRGLLVTAFEDSCEDGDWGAFGLLLQDIIEATGDKKNFAKKIGISRGHLYRLFAKNANPTIKTLYPLLAEFGLKLTASNDGKGRKRA